MSWLYYGSSKIAKYKKVKKFDKERIKDKFKDYVTFEQPKGNGRIITKQKAKPSFSIFRKFWD